MSYIETIASDYEQAEATCLYLHDRSTNVIFNLCTVIELIPAEQAASVEIGTTETRFLDRGSIKKSNYTFYIGRSIGMSVEDGIQMYTRMDGKVPLKYKMLDCVVLPFKSAHQEEEPPTGYPLIIDGKEEKTFGQILPYRNTGFRVWSKLDRNKKWLAEFDDRTQEYLFKEAGKLTMRHLGFDIGKAWEHLGNTYLCCCNPYLRSYKLSLLDHNTDLLITFRERLGRIIIGKRLVLYEKRADNIGFTIERIISSNLERIRLPYLPAQLITRLYDDHGFLLETHSGVWRNISFGMDIQQSVMNLSVNHGDKVDFFKIEKYATEKPVTIGTYDHSSSWYLKNAYESREFERLERSKEFIFFPGNLLEKEKEKAKAREIITDIVKDAQQRILLLDPYFGVADLYYAFAVKRLSVPIRILSSANFLKKKLNNTTSTTATAPVLRQAHTLLDGIQKFSAAYGSQVIECSVLTGDNSPLHDRYIVADDKVYLLGSSFNEFGTRATTLSKVPAPQPMIDKALEWLGNPKATLTLEDFVDRLNDQKEDDSKPSPCIK